jgi:selenophosphate synthetase-related protein
VILLGLTRENVRRLVDLNQPIRMSGESVGMPEIDSVQVVFGETELDIVADLEKGGLMTPDTIVHVEASKPDQRIIVAGAQPMPTLAITWDSRTEKLAATVDHALLVVPQGPDGHRAYFAATDQQLGEMLAVVIALAARRRNGAALLVAKQALGEGEPGDFRGSGA